MSGFLVVGLGFGAGGVQGSEVHGEVGFGDGGVFGGCFESVRCVAEGGAVDAVTLGLLFEGLNLDDERHERVAFFVAEAEGILKLGARGSGAFVFVGNVGGDPGGGDIDVHFIARNEDVDEFGVGAAEEVLGGGCESDGNLGALFVNEDEDAFVGGDRGDGAFEARGVGGELDLGVGKGGEEEEDGG